MISSSIYISKVAGPLSRSLREKHIKGVQLSVIGQSQNYQNFTHKSYFKTFPLFIGYVKVSVEYTQL